jgi:hypothetical protein
MGLFVLLSVIALNVLRMSLMGISRESYLFFHGPVGANVVNTLILAVAIAAGSRAVAPAAAPRTTPV